MDSNIKRNENPIIIINIFLLIIAEISSSSAVIFIKLSTAHPLVLASYRLLAAAIILTPIFIKQYNKHKDTYNITDTKFSVIPGILLSLHFIFWITGARLTLASNASVVNSTVPAVMPLVSFLLLKEKLRKWETIGTALAISGMAYLIIMDFHLSSKSFTGDVLCFLSMILFAVYISLARKYREIPSIWLYVVPLYYFAGFTTLIISLFFINPFKIPSVENIIYILSLAIIPTIFGHSLLNYLMKHFRGQTISIFGQLQFIFASILAYFILEEVPTSHLYIGSVFMIGGSIITILDYNSNKN